MPLATHHRCAMCSWCVHGDCGVELKLTKQQERKRETDIPTFAKAMCVKCLNENDQWTGSHIVFEIAEKKSGCSLSFKHSGWKEQNDFFATCSYHWARHLYILAKLCETGISELDRDTERREVRKVISD